MVAIVIVVAIAVVALAAKFFAHREAMAEIKAGLTEPTREETSDE